MTVSTWYVVAAIGLCCIGLYGGLVRRHLLRRLLAFNILGSGVFLLLVGLARTDAAGTPDPIPQAMVLTGIVVAVASTALGLALLRHWYRLSGRPVAPEEPER